MVTIYDVAKKCNCSYTTVSKVFNNTGSISEKKRQEILSVAKELGYVPNSIARSLATKKSNTIGILLHNFEDRGITHELFSKILNAFRIEVENNGYDILFLSQHHDDYLVSCKTKSIDGVFVLCCDYSLDKTHKFLNGDIPYVCFDDSEVPNSVQVNGREAVAQMVDYLASKGHSKIIYINPDDNSPVTVGRLNGFKDGLTRNNIEFDERMVQKGSYYAKDSGKIAVENAINSGLEFTAIMFPDDYTAVSATRYIRDYEKKEGRRISYTGFDGVEVTEILSKPITTIKQDTNLIGVEAAKILLNEIKGNKATSPTFIPISIYEGKTVTQI